MVIQLSQRRTATPAATPSGTSTASRSTLSPKILAPLKRALREAARCLDLPDHSEVSLLIANDPFLQELNRQYRGLDKPTDVLSFPQNDPDILGDIVISAQTARKQARNARWPLQSELALLGVHGLLHLMGYDDATEEGAIEMERLTRRVLEKCDIPLPEEEHPFFQNI